MPSNTRTCQKCQTRFPIEERDLAFYISVNVPEPTFCPTCRARRRMAWINFHSLYNRKLTDGGKNVISMYSPDKQFNVVEDSAWWGDTYDQTSYGRNYDFSRPFFTQFQELLRVAPLPHLHRDFSRMENSNYCNACTGLKNCYLCMAADEAEDTYYGFKIEKLKNCVDVSFTNNSELCGNSAFLSECYNVQFSEHCENSNDLSFCSDCNGCTSCVGCINLRNKSYCIFNVQYDKDEYENRVKEMRLDTFSAVSKIASEAQQFFRTQPHRFMHGRNNVDVTGDFIYNSKNVTDSYAVQFSENCRFVNSLSAIDERNADAYDWSQFGIGSERIYECSWCGLRCNTVLFSFWNYYAHNLTYCFGCHSSDNLFGCIGLRKKRYCILNKQYSKEDYEELVENIRKQMADVPYTSTDGTIYRYGEFFPSELSPFCYNETEAYDHLPLTKDSAVAKGFSWYDAPQRQPIAGAVSSKDIPDSIDALTAGCASSTFICSSYTDDGEDAIMRGCTRYYRCIPQEISWYRKKHIPLPRSCPQCRYRERLKHQPLFRSYDRACMCHEQTGHDWHQGVICEKQCVTSYAPDRVEPIYCEKCYSAVVY
ncbi:hypothetical protein HY732_00635 [Candidatus Uhrbacteria bacterium]|nr:hypothetical protein [Candidatus Uhrbacteria bacterium]